MNTPKIVISERSDGMMQLVGGDIALANKERFFASQGIDPRMVVSGQLVNGVSIKWVEMERGGTATLATDGLITTDPDLWLAITVADCLPIVIYGRGFVALLHGGWRGLAGGIIPSAVAMIREKLGERIELAAWIGPGIEGHHYGVGEEVAREFADIPGATEVDGETWRLDLKTVARQQIAECGIDQIEVSEECTYCQSGKYFSARYDQKSPTEAMIVVVKDNTQ